jgi:hypothetical protein
MGSELHPRDVLADLFDSDDFPEGVLGAVHAAIVIQRLIDAGFRIVPADD